MTAPDLEHLRTFVTVYRTGSFTEASALIGISQPTVTSHIRALESGLGYPLFTRHRTGVTPTARAEVLVREVAPHVDALEDITSAFPAAGDAPLAIQFGGPAELTSQLLLPKLKDLTDAAGAPIRITFGLADGMLEQLRTGTLDVVLSSVLPRVRGIESEPYFDEEFALVAAPAWAGTVVDEDNADRFSGIPVVAYAENLPIIRRFWRTVFGQRPSGLKTAAVIPDLRGIRAAVKSGLGMSVLPVYLIEKELEEGALVRLHSPEVPPLNTVHLAVRAGELSRNPHLRSFVRALGDLKP